jgi:N12 class adenine-specific DNA methylase
MAWGSKWLWKNQTLGKNHDGTGISTRIGSFDNITTITDTIEDFTIDNTQQGMLVTKNKKFSKLFFKINIYRNMIDNI